jgi:Co/Zn/Cd efflux system component
MEASVPGDGEAEDALRRTVLIVALLNLAYFGVEATVAQAIGSVSLFADSVDFLEDAAVNLLVLLALGWSLRARSSAGIGMAGILLVPGIATLWTAWEKFGAPVAPDAGALTLTGAGALLVNGACAFMLARVRGHGGSLSRAAFLSARNDVLANAAIIAAGLATAATLSPWPDLVVGLGILAMNLDAAKEVYEAAMDERRSSDDD